MPALVAPRRPLSTIDSDAERRCITVLLRSTLAIKRVPDLQPSDFSSEVYRRTMQAIREVHMLSPEQPVELAAIALVAIEQCRLGGPFVEEDWEPMLRALDVVDEDLEIYAAAVIELAIARRMIWACEGAASQLRSGQPLDDVVERLEDALSEWDRLTHARKVADASNEGEEDVG